MPLIGPAPGEVRAILEGVIAEFHPDLRDAGVTISCWFAHAGESANPPVKLHGYPCHAVVKINGLEKRREGAADAKITIDGDRWPDWTPEQRRALLDHEAEHLELVRDKKSGEVKLDDQLRPRLRMRQHDFQVGGFDSIARRHGRDAFEAEAVRILATERGQLFWAWGDDNAPPEEMTGPRMVG